MTRALRQGDPARYVAYYRVSTARQSRWGFSLEAQQAAVANYIRANPGQLVAEYLETRSALKGDRPKLAEALQLCRILNAILLIARLDRLARNVAMIAQLTESGVDFVATDFPNANRFTLHILAAIAEHESRLNSERVKAAIAAARERGTFRPPIPPKYTPGRERAGVRAHQEESQARITDLAPIVWEGIAAGKSYAMIAEEFNRSSIRPAEGVPWKKDSIMNIARATREAYAAACKARARSPAGMRRAKMLARLRKIAPSLLEWELLGRTCAEMARELDQLGYEPLFGGAWSERSTRRYLKLALQTPTAQDAGEVAR